MHKLDLHVMLLLDAFTCLLYNLLKFKEKANISHFFQKN